MIKQILISLAVTLVVSTLIAFGLTNIFGFWQAFVLSIVMQFALFFVYNNYIINKRSIEEDKLINERLELLSKNYVTFQCPCNEKVFEEVIYINGENVFKCDKCEEDIKVEVILTPMIKTTPLDIETTYKKLQNINTLGNQI